MAAQLRSEGGGGACHPAKFKEPGLSLCRGQTALHLASLRAHQEKKRGETKAAFKMCRAPKGTSFIHLLTPETHCV